MNFQEYMKKGKQKQVPFCSFDTGAQKEDNDEKKDGEFLALKNGSQKTRTIRKGA